MITPVLINLFERDLNKLTEEISQYPDDSSLVAWIRDPSKIKPDSKMPTWNGIIKEEEYKPLAEYVRSLREAVDAVVSV